MVPTKLILVEGPPGSGKSTTAYLLAEKIRQAGFSCACHLEWDADHPIPIGSDLDLGNVIATARQREEEMLNHWRRFARERRGKEMVSILESRFWQTSLMLMYINGHPLNGLFDIQQRVVDVLLPLNPVLILYTIDDLRAFTTRTIQAKEDEWQKSGFPGTWTGHIYEALNGKSWFTAHGLSGQVGYLAFLEEWAGICEQLYQQLPFGKIKVNNPYLDWAETSRQVDAFLDLTFTE